MQAQPQSPPTINRVLLMWVGLALCVWTVGKVMPLHAAGYVLAGYAGLIAAAAGILLAVKSFNAFDIVRDNKRTAIRFKQRSRAHGVARRGNLKDAAKSDLLAPGGWLIGLLNGRELRYGGESSGHIIAPARVGKSLWVMLNLTLWKPRKRFPGDPWVGSFVAVDWKGELAACTADSQRGIRDVVFINPWFVEMNRELGREFQDTGYTGFSDLDPHSRDIKADAEAKMALLLPDPPKASAEARFFKQAARTRGTMEILGLLAEGETVTLRKLFDRVQLGGDALIDHLARMRQSDAFGGVLAAMATKVYSTMLKAPEQSEGGLGELENTLSIYDGLGSLGEHVERDGFDPAILTKRPTAVYIMCPTRYTDSHGRWVNWVVATMIEAVARTKDNRRVLFVIDEAIRCGIIGNLDKATELYPSAGVSVWCVWQTMAAGIMVYGREGFNKLIDNADVVISRAVRGRDELKYLSDLIGNVTIQDGSRNLNLTDNRSDYRADYKGKPLLDVNDLRTLPDDQQIVRHKNDPIYITQAPDPRKNRRQMARLAPNPYHRRER